MQFYKGFSQFKNFLIDYLVLKKPQTFKSHIFFLWWDWGLSLPDTFAFPRSSPATPSEEPLPEVPQSSHFRPIPFGAQLLGWWLASKHQMMWKDILWPCVSPIQAKTEATIPHWGFKSLSDYPRILPGIWINSQIPQIMYQNPNYEETSLLWSWWHYYSAYQHFLSIGRLGFPGPPLWGMEGSVTSSKLVGSWRCEDGAWGRESVTVL